MQNHGTKSNKEHRLLQFSLFNRHCPLYVRLSNRILFTIIVTTSLDMRTLGYVHTCIYIHIYNGTNYKHDKRFQDFSRNYVLDQ